MDKIRQQDSYRILNNPKKSPVWKYFKQFDDPQYARYVKCKACHTTKSLGCNITKRPTLTNLRRHLKMDHWDLFCTFGWKPTHPNINDVPMEIADMIASYLDSDSFINASSAIPMFRTLGGQPRHFREITFLNKNNIVTNNAHGKFNIEDEKLEGILYEAKYLEKVTILNDPGTILSALLPENSYRLLFPDISPLISITLGCRSWLYYTQKFPGEYPVTFIADHENTISKLGLWYYGERNAITFSPFVQDEMSLGELGEIFTRLIRIGHARIKAEHELSYNRDVANGQTRQRNVVEMMKSITDRMKYDNHEYDDTRYFSTKGQLYYDNHGAPKLVRSPSTNYLEMLISSQNHDKLNVRVKGLKSNMNYRKTAFINKTYPKSFFF